MRSNDRAMLISKRIGSRAQTGARCGNSITSPFNHGMGNRDAFEYFYLDVLKLYNFNSYLTCSCFFSRIWLEKRKRRAGKAGILLAVLSRTSSFHRELLPDLFCSESLTCEFLLAFVSFPLPLVNKQILELRSPRALRILLNIYSTAAQTPTHLRGGFKKANISSVVP